MESSEEEAWFVGIGGQVDGPYNLRDLDVKFRTSELASNVLLWHESMSDWLAAFKIPKIRDLIQQGKSEATLQNEVDDNEQSLSEEEDSVNNLQSDVCYFSKNEKVWKVFKDGKWTSEQQKPTAEELVQLNLVIPSQADKIVAQTSVLTEEELLKREQKRLKRKRAQQNKKQKWFENIQNTFVYCWGLPIDITMNEVVEFFKKCGRIAKDSSGELKIKLYADEDGKLKGDCRICYENYESVEMAIELLNQSQIRPGAVISVEIASFEQKGQEYRPREIKKLEKLDKLRLKAQQQREQAWDDNEVQNVGLKIVILEGFYTYDEIQAAQDVELFIEEVKAELSEEIENSVGHINRIELFKDNPLGICKIRFESALDADKCVTLMNDRWFDQRQLKCYFWDGKIDYKVSESLESQQQRIQSFGQWLEDNPLEPEEVNEELSSKQ